MTKIPKSLLAALAKKQLMKNVSGVPANKSSRSSSSPLIDQNHVGNMVCCWQLFHQFECIKNQHVPQLKLSTSLQRIFWKLSNVCSVVMTEVRRWHVSQNVIDCTKHAVKIAAFHFRCTLRLFPLGCVCPWARRAAWVEIWLTSFTFLRTGFRLSRDSFLFCLKFSCIACGQHLVFNSCSTILRVWSNSNAAWASRRTSVLVQNALAYVQFVRSSATGQLTLWLDRWCLRRTLGCRVPRAANTQIQELQAPSAIALKTSHTARLYCSCWRQQEKFIGAGKLADQDSHIQCGSIFSMVSSKADLSEWHNFTSVVLASKSTLENCWRPMHCAGPSSSLAHVQVQFLFSISIKRLPKKARSCPWIVKFARSPCTRLPFGSFGRRNHNKIRGLAPSDQSICHIKSTWLLVTFQLCLDEAQPVNIVMKTPYHIIILATLSPYHNIKDWSVYRVNRNHHRDFPVGISRSAGCKRVVELNYRNVLCVCQLFRESSVWALGLDANLAPRTKRTMCAFVGLTLLFRRLVIGWWYLDLHLLKCVLILTVDILVSCSLSSKLVLCLAQGSLPMFCAYDGKSDSRVVFGLFARAQYMTCLPLPSGKLFTTPCTVQDHPAH